MLTGIIAGLAAQDISLEDAALCGVYLHGLVGEYASKGSVGLAAGEISQFLPEAFEDVFDMVDTQEVVCNPAIKMLE